MHQLQCFAEGGKAEEIQNCIVFDKSKLSQLYARVGELQQETADQVAKHKYVDFLFVRWTITWYVEFAGMTKFICTK